MKLDSSWSLAEGEFKSRRLLIRSREFSAEFDRSEFPIRLNVFWRMEEPHEDGLPSESEFLKLEAFENRIADAVEVDNQSVLSVLLTCNGEREFVFHTRDRDEFLRRLTAMPQEEDRYPIEINSYDDPEWDYDKSVIPGA